MQTGEASPWWRRHVHADRRPFLVHRNAIKAAIRAWFDSEGFTEVEPALLQVSPGNETHLHAFRTELVGTDLSRAERYLPTSPEFAMKKLLAAGETAIFCFAPAFRNRERGALHAPEFTMLEWYRAGEPYVRLFDDCACLLQIAGEITGRAEWRWRDVGANVRQRPKLTSVADAFRKYAGLDFAAVAFRDGAPDTARFASAALASGIAARSDDTWGDVFSRVMVERIEPNLGAGLAEIVFDYPRQMSALARPKADAPQIAERFELYVCGVELANGFGELNDPVVQLSNLEAEMAEKQRIYGERYPIDHDFIAALREMPQACGCALGFDRLVMLATGAGRIEHVQWTPLAHEGPKSQGYQK